MAYVELARGHYPKARDVFSLAWYIYDLSKCIKEVYGGKNIIMDECYNPMFIAQQGLSSKVCKFFFTPLSAV